MCVCVCFCVFLCVFVCFCVFLCVYVCGFVGIYLTITYFFLPPPHHAQACRTSIRAWRSSRWVSTRQCNVNNDSCNLHSSSPPSNNNCHRMNFSNHQRRYSHCNSYCTNNNSSNILSTNNLNSRIRINFSNQCHNNNNDF